MSTELATERQQQQEKALTQRAAEAALASRVADAERELASLRAQSRAAERELVAKQQDVAGALDAASKQLGEAKEKLAGAVGRAETEAAARVEADKRLSAVRGVGRRGGGVGWFL